MLLVRSSYVSLQHRKNMFLPSMPDCGLTAPTAAPQPPGLVTLAAERGTLCRVRGSAAGADRCFVCC